MPVCDRGDYARVLFSFCTRGCGRIARPAFPAPSEFIGRRFLRNSDASRRENALAYLDVLARSEVTKQSTPVALWIASLTLAKTVWLFDNQIRVVIIRESG
jgi:hypothetical protein